MMKIDMLTDLYTNKLAFNIKKKIKTSHSSNI